MAFISSFSQPVCNHLKFNEARLNGLRKNSDALRVVNCPLLQADAAVIADVAANELRMAWPCVLQNISKDS